MQGGKRKGRRIPKTRLGGTLYRAGGKFKAGLSLDAATRLTIAKKVAERARIDAKNARRRGNHKEAERFSKLAEELDEKIRFYSSLSKEEQRYILKGKTMAGAVLSVSGAVFFPLIGPPFYYVGRHSGRKGAEKDIRNERKKALKRAKNKLKYEGDIYHDPRTDHQYLLEKVKSGKIIIDLGPLEQSSFLKKKK